MVNVSVSASTDSASVAITASVQSANVSPIANRDTANVAISATVDMADIATAATVNQVTVTPGDYEASYTLSGYVYYPKSTGNVALEGITVKLTDTDDNVITTNTTGADGYYSLTTMAADTYRVVVDYSDSEYVDHGYSAVNATDAALISGFATTPYEIEVVRFLAADLIPLAGVVLANDAGRAQFYFLDPTHDYSGEGPYPAFNYGEYVYWWAGETTDVRDYGNPYPMTVDLSASTIKNIYMLAAGDFNQSGIDNL